MTTRRNDLSRWVRRGCTVALADGAGLPAGLCGELSAVARRAGDVRLLLGWCLEPPPQLDLRAFAEVRTFMVGQGLAAAVAAGTVDYVPMAFSQLPRLLSGPWRPDVLLLSVREGQGGLVLGSEISWIGVAARNADVLLAELNHGLPDASRNAELTGLNIVVIEETDRPPVQVPRPNIDETNQRIGDHVAALIPEGSVIQFGPGALGEATLSCLEQPVRIDSGILTDAVVDLDERELLLGSPTAGYLVGTDRLYRWADGRPVVAGVEFTHHASRLAAASLVAVNTALQIDRFGQVNVESVGSRRIAGVGGHPDFAGAASRSPNGLSIVALPTQCGGRSTLVERLDVPVSTTRTDVDVLVTENGHVDLRGLTDQERARSIETLYP